MSAKEPLVSVVTPVYNGESYLAECIESVLDQTYTNWEYIIVDNCSTDRTFEISKKYADKDSRIRLLQNEHLLEIIPNWNYSLRQISKQSKYCKVIHADDWLFPECLTRMVQLAEEHPTVGVVGSYDLDGIWVRFDGLPYPSHVISGREVVRSYFLNNSNLGGIRLLGTPSCILLRSDLIWERESFYNESNFNADSDACCNVLQNTDFGFVHQVLTYTRNHGERQSSFVNRYNTSVLNNLRNLFTYGHSHLDSHEYDLCKKRLLKIYHSYLGRSVFMNRDKDFWNYHLNGAKEVGYQFRYFNIGIYAFLELLKFIASPINLSKKIGKRLYKKHKTQSDTFDWRDIRHKNYVRQ